MRLIGAALVIASGLLLGMFGVGELRKREMLLLDLKKLMQDLKTGISYSTCPLPELAARENSQFCREAIGEASFPEDPCKALQTAGNRLLRKKEDRELYSGFIQGLGASDIQGQIQHIELYASLLENSLEGAREDREKKSRLYVSLGLFGGLALCIVML